MRRPCAKAAASCSILALCVSFCFVHHALAKPNFIVVSSKRHDASRSQTSILNGITALKEQGVELENLFTTSTVSLPAQMSLLTGRAFVGDTSSSDKVILRQEDTSLPATLRNLGYNTQLFGYDVGNLYAYTQARAWNGLTSVQLNDAACLITEKASDVINKRWITCGFEALHNEALSVLRAAAAQGSPFYLHISLPSPEQAAGLSRAAQGAAADLDEVYENYVQFVADDLLSQLAAELENLQIHERTYIAYTATAGKSDKTTDDDAPPPLDDAIRVPAIIAGPGIQPGSIFRGLASTADIMPTLLQLAGAPIPEGVTGQALQLTANPPADESSR